MTKKGVAAILAVALLGLVGCGPVSAPDATRTPTPSVTEETTGPYEFRYKCFDEWDKAVIDYDTLEDAWQDQLAGQKIHADGCTAIRTTGNHNSPDQQSAIEVYNGGLAADEVSHLYARCAYMDEFAFIKGEMNTNDAKLVAAFEHLCPERPDMETLRTKAATAVPLEPPSMPAPPDELSERELALIAKDPDSHKGTRITVFGVVSQFDSATGKCAFLAQVGESTQTESWLYPHSMFIDTSNQSNCPQLDQIVAGDHVRIVASVQGAMQYRTTFGGTTTVPQLTASSVTPLPKIP